jgi:hypothetical protein
MRRHAYVLAMLTGGIAAACSILARPYPNGSPPSRPQPISEAQDLAGRSVPAEPTLGGKPPNSRAKPGDPVSKAEFDKAINLFRAPDVRRAAASATGNR